MERLTDTQRETFRILQLLLTWYLQIYFSLSKPFFSCAVTGMLANMEIFFSVSWLGLGQEKCYISQIIWTILFQRCQKAKLVKVFI